jgi:hypothetical protein
MRYERFLLAATFRRSFGGSLCSSAILRLASPRGDQTTALIRLKNRKDLISGT